ncbi:hypothetical protein BB776_01360 [Planococcus salinarum]|uniref:Uncharacterized protein n=1 Tax=Planococcus salinarum TaxID=622695 RepID=A0ABX3D2P6_9BACL|nr:hypothetical protein BB776_01360 [Planococcus salinarum]
MNELQIESGIKAGLLLYYLLNFYLYKLNNRVVSVIASSLWTGQRLCSCALLVAKVRHLRLATFAPAISREEHSSLLRRHSPAPEPLRRLGGGFDRESFIDMEQKSEDAQGSRNAVGFPTVFRAK